MGDARDGRFIWVLPEPALLMKTSRSESPEGERFERWKPLTKVNRAQSRANHRGTRAKGSRKVNPGAARR